MIEKSRGAHLAYTAIAVIVAFALVAVALISYNGGFQRTTRVYLDVQRAGLMMDAGSDVKVSGAVVGRVSAVEVHGSGARITLDLDTDKAAQIPTNVEARLDPTTLFGRKFVTLSLPDRAARQTLRAGAVIGSTHSPVEVSDTFELLLGVLDRVDPAQISSTLTALDRGVSTRGDTLGTLIESVNTYLGEFNQSIPVLQRDLKLGADNLETFTKMAPDLMETVDNATITSSTIVDERAQLTAFLLSFTRFGNTGARFTEKAGKPLAGAAAALAPTLTAIEPHSAIYPCFFGGLNNARKYLEKAFGGERPGLDVLGTLILGNPPYRPGVDAPKNNAGSASPSCYGYPFAADSPGPGHIDFDTGSHAYRKVAGPGDVIGNPFASMIYGLTK